MTRTTYQVLLVLCLLTCWLSLNVLAGSKAYLESIPAAGAAPTCLPWPADDCDERTDCVEL